MSAAETLPLEGGRPGPRDAQRSLTKSFGKALKLGGTLTETSWQPPPDMTERQWRQAGVAFAAMETGVSWWVGDWWRAFKPEWGERAKLFTDDWQGPAYATCRHASAVCDAFDIGRRRPNLSFSHHVEVASLPQNEADRLLDWCEETETPRSVRELRSAYVNHRNASRLAQIAQEAQEWPTGRYSIIYADPPWQYDHPLSTTREIENQYPTMDIDDICALPVNGLAADRAMLFLWVPPSFLHKGIRVIEAWGFEYLTSMVWDKQRDGMGYYVRQRHESVLVGHIGDGLVPPPATLSSSIVSVPRGEHSAKPDEFYEIIERMYTGLRKIELFSRRYREGWEHWGNQAVAAE